jgi:TRAP-type C4-dicarboxylate transport system, small permease component
LKILRWLDEHFEEYVLSGLLVVISVVMMLQVIMRYVFNASLSWAEEASRYAFVWSALVSIGYSIKENSILKVDTLVEALPAGLKHLLITLINISVTLFFGYLLISSIPAVQRVIMTRSDKSRPENSPWAGFIPRLSWAFSWQRSGPSRKRGRT